MKLRRKKKQLPEGVRMFQELKVKLIRLGREAVVIKGAFGKLDLKRERIEVTSARVDVTNVGLDSEKIEIDLANNRLTAKGEVKIEEHGVTLTGDELTAQPSLTGLQFKGKVRLQAKDLEAAEALLKSGML